ncbi:MAG: CRISPR-associated CARF protein Csx1 [Thermosediminibacteraceae bacterium]|nr:CRISPR-associated CARF protein Csx1 [Thermosediminibacteraceae bacterium]
MGSVIYQIGRLDSNIMEELDFRIEGRVYRKKLSCFALKEYLKENAEDVKAIVVYPVSLPFNEKLKKFNLGILSEKINKILENPEDYLSDPKSFFTFMPYAEEIDEFFVIHSIGEYCRTKFEVAFNDIVFELALDMMERYLKGEITKVYIDISSGHNIYVSALLEAVRFFSTWVNLKNWLPESRKTEIWLTFSDPILGNEVSVYDIHMEKLEFKSFFSSPINKKDLDENIVAKRIYENDREKKRKLSRLLENFATIFSAIKNNAPLAVYYLGYDKDEGIEETIKMIIEDMKRNLYTSYKKSPNLDKNTYTKAILSLGLYYGIVKVLKHYGVCGYNEEEGVSLEEIKNNFSGMYELFKLKPNNEFLGNEISSTEKAMEEVVDDSKWYPLARFLQREYRDPEEREERVASRGELKKRNFLAHAGLERNITEVRKSKGQIFARYKNEFKIVSCDQEKIVQVKDIIKRWLKDEV